MYSAIGLAGEPFSEIVPAPAASMPRSPTPRERIASDLAVGLEGIWLSGFAAVMLIWYVRWHKLSGVLRKSRQAFVGREINAAVRRSRRAGGLRGRIPAATIERPAGAWHLRHPPASPALAGRLSEHLDDEHMEAILAHELMHVRRHDNLTAALHMLVEAVFWFHPLVWWMEQRMVEERERACDEAVIQMGGQPEAYAESLLKACRFCVESPLRCVSGITGGPV